MKASWGIEWVEEVVKQWHIDGTDVMRGDAIVI